MIFLYVVLLCVQIYRAMETAPVLIAVQQDRGFKTANVGDNLTLHCSCQDPKLMFFTWYRQKLGGKPELVSHRLRGSTSPTTAREFQRRFRTVGSLGELETNHLQITDLRASDSATYFCGIQVFGYIEFGEGVFVRVRSSASPAQSVVQEGTSKELQRGDPLALSCTVEAEKCSGDKRFYWLRHGSSRQAIVFPENDCGTSTKNCTVKLKIESVEPTDAGVYYCVLSSCGEILFGNGTAVQIAGSPTSRPLVYWLSIALGLFFVTTMTLMIVVCKLKRNTSENLQRPAANAHCRARADVSEVEIHYAAINMNSNPEPRNQEDTENGCTYSSVRSRKL